MQAVILAGGLGTRLLPLTESIPKPMVRVAGAPYLEHQLHILRRQGFTNVVLLTGYLGDQIESYFGDGRQLGLSVQYSRESTPIGTGGALRQAAHLLQDPFLLIYGDSYLPIQYRGVIEELERSTAIGVVVVYDNHVDDTSVRNNIALDAGSYIARYEKDAADTTDLHYVEAGVMAFRLSVIERLPREGFVSLEKEIFPRLIAGKKLLGYRTDQRFYDIGTPDRLKAIEHYFHDHHTDALPD